MAFIGIRVPPETSRLLSGIEVPGDREAPSSMHITMIFLGQDVPIEQIAKAMLATYSITSGTRPFTVQTNRVTFFPRGDDGVPIICRVDSDPLHELRKAIAAAFDEAGVDFNKKFPEYKPHVTLSYAEEEVEEQRIPTVEWGAHELVLWGGNEGDQRIVITFPFSLEPELVERVAQRHVAVG